MTSRSSSRSNQGIANALQKKQSIPVQLNDLAMFDNAYAFMKERFTEEMRRIDQQMTTFSSDLSRFYGQTATVQTGSVSPRPDNVATTWEVLTSSPLVQGEGNDRTLKLQYDVSQFDPTEVKVKICNDILEVSATHEEKTTESTVYREYKREFLLPPGTKPELVISSLSRDGVLTVQLPLPPINNSATQRQIQQKQTK